MARSDDVPKSREGVEAAAVNWTHALMDITVRKSAPTVYVARIHVCIRSCHVYVHV
jgi:hypothetical protein